MYLNKCGSVAKVTGGSSGIGLQVAIEVARQGASVTLLARNPVHALTWSKLIIWHN